ncbi:MAG: ABC transporter permease [Rhodospirillales bacterium]|nr:ABC transporter permease [Rhodospirillales bacterium]
MTRFLKHFRYVMGENPVTVFAFSLFTVILFMGIFGHWIAPYDPLATNTAMTLKPPSWSHPFGTDHLGRDVFSRVIVATRLDLGIAVSAVALSFLIGSALGCSAGFWGGWPDRIIGRFSDTIMAFPLFVLAMGIVAAMGNSVENIIYATAIINLPFYIRVSRTEASVRRNAGYVNAARLSGCTDGRILATQVFPNILPPMMIQISLNMGWAILNAAGLSFIGLGVRPPDAEWGIMVAEGATYIVSGEWWLALFPGAALMTAVFCFNLLGDGLRDLVDPLRRT